MVFERKSGKRLLKALNFIAKMIDFSKLKIFFQEVSKGNPGGAMQIFI